MISNNKRTMVKKSPRVSDIESASPPETLQRIRHLQVVLEQLYDEIERQQQFQRQQYDTLKSETAKALDELRIHTNLLLSKMDTTESPLSFDLPIDDEKLKKAWQVLFRHPDGATAETIALELKRHRSTVSTYLNMLKTMGYADNFRKGHEIYYKAIIKTGKEEKLR